MPYAPILSPRITALDISVKEKETLLGLLLLYLHGLYVGYFVVFLKVLLKLAQNV